MLALGVLLSHPAHAQSAGAPDSQSAGSNLLGGMGGARSWLDARGISYGITETSELLANVTGGVHTGPAYDGLTSLGLGLDTKRRSAGKAGPSI